MAPIWRTVSVVATLLALSDAISDNEATDSRVTFTDSALMLRLINTNYENGGGSSGTRFLRKSDDDELADFGTEEDDSPEPADNKEKAAIPGLIKGLAGQIPTALCNFFVRLLTQTNKP
ncbi:hypothetical protein PHYPSEUDO_002914 [Phytophthora pseudosyringae]|uniref:RxLR effector protein n=1 Tax=Phytophthora pseudosyringae TaxID=221518 RepID=A0A8T1VW52_9STRA|nr:hypothetical protein PHYPSEUDO_002914 [Phytophthora pseudosyringae]